MSKRIFNIVLIVFQLTAFSYYAWLRIHNANLVREPRTFGDTNAYHANADLPIFSREFWTHERPPLTALFWKAAGNQPERIFGLQLYFSILAWGILAVAAASVVQSQALKPFAYSIVLAFSLSRDVFMWDPFLGSESISLSLAALFSAASLWLLLEWDWRKAALVVFIALLLVLTRDTYAYFLLMVAAAALPVFWFSAYRWQAVGISAAFVLLYLFSAWISVLGMRPFRAVLMNTALRIYPSEAYTAYFREHGMPVDDELAQLARNPQPGKKFSVYAALLLDADQEEYRRWALASGSSEYVKFLWFYKSDTFQKAFLETPGPSFYPDVYYYTATGYRPIIKDQRVSEILYPTRFGLLFFFAANLFAAFVSALAWRDRKALWFAPLLMILLTYPQAALVWAADANDIPRHAIAYNVLLRLGVWLLLFFILDATLLDLRSKWAQSKHKTSA
jgi:hypothetical protein